jgi:hypothetical protein
MNEFGPDLPFPSLTRATVRLPETGHSCAMQHLKNAEDSNTDEAAEGFPAQCVRVKPRPEFMIYHDTQSTPEF